MGRHPGRVWTLVRRLLAFLGLPLAIIAVGLLTLRLGRSMDTTPFPEMFPFGVLNVFGSILATLAAVAVSIPVVALGLFLCVLVAAWFSRESDD